MNFKMNPLNDYYTVSSCFPSAFPWFQYFTKLKTSHLSRCVMSTVIVLFCKPAAEGKHSLFHFKVN